jgi:hypothetical protein
MPAPSEIVIDQWSPLSHKDVIGDPFAPNLRRSLAPSWVPVGEQRRIDAYRVLAAYRDNVARWFLTSTLTVEQRREWREYGDVASFSDRVVASILGEDWTITVDGAAGELEPPSTDARPADPPAEASPLERKIVAARQRAWDRDAGAAVEAWVAALDAQPAAREREQELRRWAAEDAQLAARLDEGEHDAVDLGDAVYVLWPRPGGWPTVQVFDPGFYFPDLESVVRDEFPRGVALAWEFDKPVNGAAQRWVRRLSWRLVELNGLRTTEGPRGDLVWTDDDGTPLEPGQLPRLEAGVTIGGDGVMRRRLPWHVDVRDASRWTCVFSDGEWPLDAVQAGQFDALDDAKATWHVRGEDLGFDFIPVIHEPDTPTGKEHFGRALVLRVSQLLDDIAQTDTRIMEASQYLGAPAIGVENASLDSSGSVLAPGRMYSGKFTTLDLSAGIDRLMALASSLEDRFLRNVGAPGELFGATGESVGMGHLALKYAPWAQVVAALRLPREPKMALMLKMVQRMAQLAVDRDNKPLLPPGPTPVARISYGSFLPMNQAEAVKMVGEALAAHAVSTQTAVSLLVAAGFPIDDARAEVDRIVAENTKAAFEVAEAFAGAPGAERVVAERLGVADQVGQIPVAPAGPAPSPTLPPAGA